MNNKEQYTRIVVALKQSVIDWNYLVKASENLENYDQRNIVLHKAREEKKQINVLYEQARKFDDIRSVLRIKRLSPGVSLLLSQPVVLDSKSWVSEYMNDSCVLLRHEKEIRAMSIMKLLCQIN